LVAVGGKADNAMIVNFGSCVIGSIAAHAVNDRIVRSRKNARFLGHDEYALGTTLREGGLMA
jgi:hypothetical protein